MAQVIIRDGIGRFAEHKHDPDRSPLPTPAEPIAAGRLQPGEYVKTAPATWFGFTYEDEVNIATGLTDEQFDTLQNTYLEKIVDSDEIYYSDYLTDDELIEGVRFTASDFDDASRERAVRDLHKFLSENTLLLNEARAEFERKGITNPLQRIAQGFWQARSFDGGFIETDLRYETAEALNEAAEEFGRIQSHPRGRNLTFS